MLLLRPIKFLVKLVMTLGIRTIMGIAGGIILLVVGYTGTMGIYGTIIDYAVDINLISENYGFLIESILVYLAMGGGITVIIGSLLLSKIRGLGVWLIRYGAGISLASLFGRIFFLGPIIQSYVGLAYEDINNLFFAFRILSVEVGLVGFGVLLSFMATFKTYKWTILLGAVSLVTMIAGLSSDPRIFDFVKNMLGVSAGNRILDAVCMFFLYIGSVLLVAALLVGIGYTYISKIIVKICLVITMLVCISVVIDIGHMIGYVGWVPLLQYIRILGIVTEYIGGIYFIKKA